MEETALPAYFGELLKFRRKQLDLTQVELAQRAGCSLPALRKIESGERRPSKQLAGLIANSLEIPSDDQPTFIRVARGELNIERLWSSPSFHPDKHATERDSPEVRSNLPSPLTSLIGREAELAAVGKLLADPRCRLLTITGLGGVGKTRLSIEAARQHQDLFPGGMYFIPLASLNAPEYIVPAIAVGLGLTFPAPLDPLEQLLNHLSVHSSQSMLLILDNLEHLLEHSGSGDTISDAAHLLAEILRRAQRVKIMVTSREGIKIHGEWIFELNGLPYPTSDQYTLLDHYSATALFLQRARQVNADFNVLPDERASLARICQMVEGTPLAIELAAAWVGMLSIQEIYQEIAANLDFLSTVARDMPERHRSLRATFEHSWKLLSIEERLALSQLAVFRGGFSREAATQVAGASLQTLLSLFSKSLIMRKENGRYDLHEIVRQFALSHLENPHKENTREKHCNYYLGLVHGEAIGFSEVNQWINDQILEDDLDNLRAAMSWGLWNEQVKNTLQIATALGQFWYSHGYWREGLEWLDWGLTAPVPVSDVVRAKALTVAGHLTGLLGDFSRAIAMLNESLNFWDKSGDKTGIAQTMCNLGAVIFRQGNDERAIAMLEEALSVAIQQDDRRGKYCSLENLGHAASMQGKPQIAIKRYNEALTLARKANDENQVAHILNAIGDEYMMMSDYERAEDYFSMAAQICHRLGSRLVGAFVSGNRGFIALKLGNYDRAFGMLTEALLELLEMGAKEEVILGFEPMALIALERHFPERAARLLGASETLRLALGVIRSQPMQVDFDAYTTRACSQLGEIGFETAYTEGSAMTYEQAVSYALDRPS